MFRAYPKSDLYRDVEMATLRELKYLQLYCSAALQAQCPPKGSQELRLFYQCALHHIKLRLKTTYS